MVSAPWRGIKLRATAPPATSGTLVVQGISRATDFGASGLFCLLGFDIYIMYLFQLPREIRRDVKRGEVTQYLQYLVGLSVSGTQ